MFLKEGHNGSVSKVKKKKKCRNLCILAFIEALSYQNIKTIFFLIKFSYFFKSNENGIQIWLIRVFSDDA